MAEMRRLLASIERFSDPCQTYAQKPRRFKFSLREDRDFSATISVHIFNIDGKPILHVVDKATSVRAVR